MKEQKDSLDELITCRIAERQRKLGRMQEMESVRRKMWSLKPMYFAIAACLVAVAFVVSLPQQEFDVQEVSRSASPEVQQYLNDGDLEKALEVVALQVAEAESAIAGLVQEDTTDEEIAYELMVERQKREDMKRLEEKISEKKSHRGLRRLLPCINKRK